MGSGIAQTGLKTCIIRVLSGRTGIEACNSNYNDNK
jgi:hypothetical protein